MASFIIRVELHGVNYDDSVYTALHEAMQKAGFTRTIKANDGNMYHLLAAGYHLESSNLTSNMVLKAAQIAADTTAKKNSVFVAEYSRARWNNLTPA